jgi:FixJ family two-component response regulator
VLVIDDDVGTLIGYKHILRAAGYDVSTAALGEDGIAAANGDGFDVVLCDQRLPDVSGVDVIRHIRASCPGTAIALVTAWGTPELLVEAMRAGANTYAEKPLIDQDLIAVIHEARSRQAVNSTAEETHVGYAARRWAELVIRATQVPDDIRTVVIWAHAIGMAPGTLKMWCRAAGVTPKRSLDLARLLNIVRRHQGELWEIQRRLDIIDDRTRRLMMHRAGFGERDSTVPDVETFLNRQQLVRDVQLLNAVRNRLSTAPRHPSLEGRRLGPQ